MQVKLFKGILEKNSMTKVVVTFMGHEQNILNAQFGSDALHTISQVGVANIASPAEEAERLENKYGKLDSGQSVYSSVYPTLESLVNVVKEYVADGSDGGDKGPVTVKELQAFLAENGIEFDPKAKKPELEALYNQFVADQGGDGGDE